jgi:segregation and condensation protein B
MSDLKNRLESILFASGKALNLEELSRLTRERDLAVVRKALLELQQELEEKKGSVMLVNEGDEWKLSVREKYLPFIRKIVTKTELPKSVVETLAVVAYKAPVLQSKVIHIRTNKAYKHLDFLEEKGYISREKKGRTKLIKLTQKFFEYFDIPPEKLKEKFKGFEELDKAIEEMEKLEPPEGSKSSEQNVLSKPKEVDLVDEEGHKVELKQYDTEPELEPYTETPSPVEEYVEKVDGLETYGEKKKHHKKKKHKKKKEDKKEEKKKPKEETPEEEEEFEPPTEEELAAALAGAEEEGIEEEAEEKEEEAVEEEPEERAEEEAEKEITQLEEEEKQEEEEVKEEEKPKKEKKEKKKKGKKGKKKEEKEEIKEEVKEEPKPEPRKKISAREIHEKARELAEKSEKAPPKYETEGIFKGEIPKELQEKISKRAEEIAYGEKPEIEAEEKRELSFEEKPELPKEKKKEEIEAEEKEELRFEEKPELKAPKPPKPEKKKEKEEKEKSLLE